MAPSSLLLEKDQKVSETNKSAYPHPIKNQKRKGQLYGPTGSKNDRCWFQLALLRRHLRVRPTQPRRRAESLSRVLQLECQSLTRSCAGANSRSPTRNGRVSFKFSLIFLFHHCLNPVPEESGPLDLGDEIRSSLVEKDNSTYINTLKKETPCCIPSVAQSHSIRDSVKELGERNQGRVFFFFNYFIFILHFPPHSSCISC